MIYTEYRDLDIAKGDKSHTLVEPIYLRQGEGNGTKILATVYDGNKVLNVTGYSVAFCMENPDGQYVEPVTGKVENGSNGQISVTVTHDMTEVPGTTEIAYFQLRNGAEIVDTDSIELKILDSYDLSPRADGAYRTKIEKLVDYLEVLKATFTDIKNIAVTYKAGASGTTAPTGTYTSAIPTVGQGEFLWAKVQVNYSNGTNQAFYMCARQGKDNTTWGVATPTTDGLMSASDKKRLDGINDYTTGINLLRGTRDFYLTNNIHPDINAATFPLDGFIIGGAAGYIWEFAKDNEGYTVASVSQSGLNAQKVAYINASLVPVKYGDVLTISADFMVDNLSDLTSQDVLPAYLFASGNPNPLKTINSGTLQSKAKEPVESGKWVQLSYSIKIDIVNADWLMIRGILAQNGSIHFRKFSIQHGSINNPIYSVNPADMALEPVNDITTGINLLRDTRDFAIGKTKVGTGNGNVYYDGFSFLGTWNRSINEQGYTEITNGQTSVPQIYGFIIDDFTVGSQYYTFSVEMKVSDVSKMGTGIIFALALIDKNGTSITGTTTNLTIEPTDKTELADGKWHRITFHAIPKSSPDAFGLRVSLVSHEASEANVISYRKPLVYKGVIENPEWTASPFDVNNGYVIVNESATSQADYRVFIGSNVLTVTTTDSTTTKHEIFDAAASKEIFGKALDVNTDIFQVIHSDVSTQNAILCSGYISHEGGCGVSVSTKSAVSNTKYRFNWIAYVKERSHQISTLDLPGGQVPVPLPSLSAPNHDISTLLPDDRQVEIEPPKTD